MYRHRRIVLPSMVTTALCAGLITGCTNNAGDQAEVERQTLVVTASGQPFDYWASTSALLAFGQDAPGVLDEMGYQANRVIWDDGFADALDRRTVDEVAWISLGAAARVDAVSDGDFLDDDQRSELTQILDDMVEEGPEPSEPLPTDSTDATTYEVARAASVNLVATALDHRVDEVRALLNSDRISFVDADIDCSVESWTGARNWVVSERLAGSLGLDCTPEDIRSAWDAVAEQLETDDSLEADEATVLELSKIVALVPIAYPELFESDDIDRVQALTDRVLGGQSLDPYIWLDSYRWLNGYAPSMASGSDPYDVQLSEDAREVLLHIASRGAVPALEFES